MRKVLMMPVLAAVVFAAACADSSDPTTVTPPPVTPPPVTPPPVTPPPAVTTASVRFFNATTNMTARGGFTTNGQFTSGSAIEFGQSTLTCSKVDAGSASFAFGPANTGATSLNGNAVATLNNQNMPAGGNFTVVAGGSATSPTLFMFDNTFSGTVGTQTAAVRFVNLAPGSGTTANTYVVFPGPIGLSPMAINIAFGASSTFKVVASGPSTFSLLRNPGHNIAHDGIPITLSAGSVNTMAIIPTASGGVQLINIERC